MYFREKEAVFFSFVFPILMLSMFSVIFGDQLRQRGAVAASTRPGSSCRGWSRPA